MLDHLRIQSACTERNSFWSIIQPSFLGQSLEEDPVASQQCIQPSNESSVDAAADTSSTGDEDSIEEPSELAAGKEVT
jgi:hypothetical protein